MQSRYLSVLLIVCFTLCLHQSVWADVTLDGIREAIREHGASWTAGPNPIWNLSNDEREMRYGLHEVPADPSRTDSPSLGQDLRLPEAFDWRDVAGLNYISGIRNQLDCGSCWAFGAIACMEAKYAIDLEIPFSDLDLSEQSLVSCSNGSCDGWNKPATCNYLQSTGAPCEDCLPYEADDTIPCADQCSYAEMEMLRIADWGYTNGTIDGVKTRLIEGPVYVGYDIYEDFDAYTGGVYEHVWGDYEAGHGVAIIGWNDADSCWICKNSWGPDWGEDGYFRIKWGECRIENNSIWMTVEPARRPNLTVSGIELEETVGDGDGVVNPGERAGLSFWIKNDPFWAPAYDVTISLLSSDRLEIIQGIQTIQGEIFSGDSIYCTAELEIELDTDGPVGIVPLGITLQSNEGMEYEYDKSTTIPIESSLSMPDWPLASGNRFSGAVASFEHQANMYIAAGDYAGNLHLFTSEGDEVAGWPITVAGSIRSAPAIVDLDDDGNPEIIIGTMEDIVAVYGMDGQEHFTVDVGGSVVAPVTVFDMGGDTRPEIVVATMAGDLWVMDSSGNTLPGWPVDLGSMFLGGPALVQRNGMHFICCGGTDGNLHLLDGEGNELPGWPVDLDESIRNGPVSTELEEMGDVRIFCASDRSVSMMDFSGAHTELYTGSSFIRSSLIILDMDGDDLLDAVFATSDLNLHVIDQNGDYLPGWPRAFEGSAYSEVAALDLNADETPELIYTTDWGLLYVLDAQGNVLQPSPVRTDMEFLSEPSLVDLDGDNDVEAIIGTESGLAAFDIKDQGAEILWATHRKDLFRTGFYGTIKLAAPLHPTHPKISSLELLSCHPIPTKNEIVLRFKAPSQTLVLAEIYDMTGKRQMIETFESAIDISEKRLSLKSLPAGAYQLRLRAGKHVASRRILHIP